MAGPLYLGVDLGSQSLKLFIIDDKLEPVTEANVSFDKDLPHYQTTGGFHIHGASFNKEVTGPTLMWVEALERCFAQLVAQKAPLDRVVAISGSAQQHGSVYWKRGALQVLQDLTPDRTLIEQTAACFVVTESPVWMDSSTTRECLELEARAGGAAKVAAVTGSRAFERFTGNQIAKLLRTQPEKMKQCERISLVSSFLASLLVGGYAPIDVSDGSGMNLLDVKSRTWCPDIVNITASAYPHGPYNLYSRLGEVVESFTCVGQISNYFTTRFGLPPTCKVITFSGDNNNALIGLKLTGHDIAVSMGTSDTIFASLKKATPRVVGHVFAHPVIQGNFMAMLCYSNGSLTREHVRDDNVGKDWGSFERALEGTEVGNKGNIGFYFLNREIIPQGGHGVHTFGKDGEARKFSAEENIRAVVEGQFMSMRLHCAELGLEVSSDSRIFVTGGGSRSKGILQVLADVFGCPVLKDTKSAVNSAAFGAALRACHGDTLLKQGLTHADSAALYSTMVASQQSYELMASPRKECTAIYTQMLPKYAALEAKVMSQSSKL
eukprot:TRINITY_DN15187_c0_g1_i1.p1 TRINITY_DN15187_c0_g1~~TRINITY_DN15187_c0_g1_i1.p1  ORF type:complete len:561 (+),score=145.78 TRINITY_DN15187_c0_g1_i1:34-1683(+)